MSGLNYIGPRHEKFNTARTEARIPVDPCTQPGNALWFRVIADGYRLGRRKNLIETL
jgi:hypothetical protein